MGRCAKWAPIGAHFFYGLWTMMDKEKLQSICETALEAVGYDLVDLEYAQSPHGWVLRVFIDHPVTDAHGEPVHSSITHDDCEVASRHLGTVLDVEDPIDAAYRLEMSSPGVHRPVRKMRDFKRFVGQRIRVVMQDLCHGRRKFLGTILEAGEGEVVVEEGGKRYGLPLAEIKKARLEAEI